MLQSSFEHCPIGGAPGSTCALLCRHMYMCSAGTPTICTFFMVVVFSCLGGGSETFPRSGIGIYNICT